VSLTQIYRGIMPFLMSDLLRLLLICAFPALSLFLPSTM